MTDYKTDYSRDKNINTLNKGSYGDFGDLTPAKQVLAKITNPDDVGKDLNKEYDIADGVVSAIRAIYKTLNGIAHGEADTTYDQATIIGISITGATDGNRVKYQIDGRLEDSSFAFPLNDPLYLGLDGNITNIPPISGHRTRLGTSLGIGTIQIEIEEPIIL
tara:strand:+ start:2219 stop:2704 length:486 start_codon:yes stop_codon:yes gene_type:complete